MAETLYNKFSDLAALQKEKDKVLALFKEVKTGIIELSSLGFKVDTSGSRKQTDELLKATEKLIKTQGDYGKQLEVVRLKQKEVNEANRDSIKLAQSQDGSITELRVKLKLLQKEYDGLGKAQRDAGKGNTILNQIKLIDTELKSLEGTTGRFQRNVGNYANSLGDGFELVRREITKLQIAQKGLLETGDTRGADAATVRIRELDNIIKVVNKDGQSFDKTVQQLQRSYSNLASSGQQSNEFLQEFKKFVADAKDQSEDLKEEIKALSSDTRKLDLAAGSVSFLADSFQLAAGTAQLLGASEEDAAKATAQLVAVQSVANGLKGIANELTTKGTAANLAYAFVQRQVNIVMAEGIVTAKGLKAALGLLGIVVTVIGGIAAAFGAFKAKLSETAKEQERLNKINEQAADSYLDQKLKIESLVVKIKDENTTNEEKKKILAEVNEKYSDVAGQLTDVSELETKFVANAPAYIKSIELRAKAQAAFSLAVEESKTVLIEQANLEKLLASGIGNKKFGGDAFGFNAISGVVVLDKVRDDIEKSKKAQNSFLKSYAGFLKEADTLTGQSNLGKAIIEDKSKDNPAGRASKDSGISEAKQLAERIARANLDAGKIQLEAEADIQKQILEVETFSQFERITALKKYVELKAKIINADADFELTKAGLTGAEKNLIQAKRIDDLRKLSDDSLKLLKNTAKDEVGAIVEELEKIPQENIDILDKISSDLDNKFLKELKDKFKIFSEEEKKQLQETKDNWIDTYQTIAGTIGEVTFGFFDAQKNRIQEQINDIDRLKAAEIARINESGDNEEKKAARIKIVEAKAQADREALERRQRVIDRQRALAERAFKVFQITTDTIQAVNKIKLLIASAPDPITKALYGSQLALAIASGAGSLVSLLATPIPKFFTGKKASDPYTGIGEVADRGPELMIYPGGHTKLFTKPTHTFIPKGATILPNQVTNDIIKSGYQNQLAIIGNFNNQKQIDYTGHMEKQTDILKRIERKQSVTVVNNINLDPYYYNQLKN